MPVDVSFVVRVCRLCLLMSIALDPPLNLDDLHHWRACARRFWLHRHGDAPCSTSNADGWAHAGVVHNHGVDVALRAAYPLADFIVAPKSPAEWARAMRQTLQCLDANREAPEGWAILGACLTSADGVQVRVDVVTRGERGLNLFKVRYATVGDDADVDAVALWTHVAARCGLRVQSMGLLLVDADFIYPGHGCYAGLFRKVDLGPVLGSRPIAAWLNAMHSSARGSLPPAAPGPQCSQGGSCAFAHQCPPCNVTTGAPASDPQASLEIVGRELAADLRAQGHADLHSVAPDSLSNARHRRAVRAIQQGAPLREPDATALVRALPYPRHSLRFDTIGFAVPAWSGTRPYQVLPFQWTCDVQTADGHITHLGFLAEAQGGDPRRAFACTLLQALGTGGAVLAYNAGFERNRIRDLAQCFDDLAPALEALLPRIVDLFQIARAHYYHPAMAGSWSFRSIARAVAPDLPSTMDCAGKTVDDSTQAFFARTLQPGLDPATGQQLRAALHANGQRQTQILRRIVVLLEGPADGMIRNDHPGPSTHLA